LGGIALFQTSPLWDEMDIPYPHLHPLRRSILAPLILGPSCAKLVPPRFLHAGFDPAKKFIF